MSRDSVRPAGAGTAYKGLAGLHEPPSLLVHRAGRGAPEHRENPAGPTWWALRAMEGVLSSSMFFFCKKEAGVSVWDICHQNVCWH